MPPKRRRADKLTGGTGDIKPQQTTVSHTAANPDDYTVTSLPLPINKLSGFKDSATIVEFLRVQFLWGHEDAADTGNTNWVWLTTRTARTTAETSTLATMGDDWSDTKVIVAASYSRNLTTSGAQVIDLAPMYDLTDGMGNGILVATDNILLISGNVGGTAGITVAAKIYYRLFSASVVEYVGIVQSQV